MKTFKTVSEAVKEMKERVGFAIVVYKVDGKTVPTSDFRQTDKPVREIYRCGLEIHVCK